ncbi:unnamed protein product [Brassica oleracea var. botrytis]
MSIEVFILFGKGLPFIEGDDWVRHRRILNPAFTMDRLKVVMTKRMVDCTLRMLEEWRKQISGEEVMMRMEINKDFHRLISDIIATTAFGSSYRKGLNCLNHRQSLRSILLLLSEAYSSQEHIFCFFFPKYLPTPTNLQLWKLDKKVKDSIKRIIDARLKSNSKNYGDDLLGIMLKAATSKESEKTMSMDEIIEECKTLYISGQGSSSILLTWTTLHQDWQEKLREEVFNECGKDTVPDSDTFSKLKPMNMVLMESLRLYGPVIKMVREATQDMKIGHLDIPKGTSIIVPFLKMHTDKAIWGEDAQQFNPMRFENGVSQAANQPNAFLPFSVGPRTCIAQNFAMMETKTVLTMIVQRFRISLSSEYKHAPVDNFNLHPQYGLPVMLQPLNTKFKERNLTISTLQFLFIFIFWNCNFNLCFFILYECQFSYGSEIRFLLYKLLVFHLMEVLSTINLLALVLLPFVVPRIWEAYWLILLRPCMDDNKKIQETRNLRSKIQIRVRKPQEIKKMKKEANCWVLDSNSNDIFPRVFPHYHQWLSQYVAVLSKLVLFMHCLTHVSSPFMVYFRRNISILDRLKVMTKGWWIAP